MLHSTVLVLMLVGCTSGDHDLDDCDHFYYQALNCNFQNSWDRWCSWNKDNGLALGWYNRNCFSRLDYSKTQGSLTSENVCSTRGKTFCLKFKYYFNQNNKMNLSVIVRTDAFPNTDSTLWTLSGGSGWSDAEVPITTRRNFVIVFKAMRREINAQRYYVAFDDIEYVHSACDTFPERAMPHTPVTTTKRVPTSKITTTTKVQTSQITTTTKVQTSQTTTTTSVRTTQITADPKPTTARTRHSAAELSESSQDVGATVGTVFAVLIAVVIIVVVVLIVVMRRKRLGPCKEWFRRKQEKEDFRIGVTHNAVYGLNNAGLNHRSETDRDQTIQGAGNLQASAREPEHASQNYEVIRDSEGVADSSTVPEYAKVNKPRKPADHQASAHQKKPKTTVYENAGNPAVSADNTDVSYANLPSNSHRETESTGYANAARPLAKSPATDQQEPSGVYHILEKQQDQGGNSLYHVPRSTTTNTPREKTEEYNALDFDRKDHQGLRSQNGEGAVYSHLNEGDEDPYNEVDREQRVDVIDEEYSHIK